MKRIKPFAYGLILAVALLLLGAAAAILLRKPAPRGITADSLANIAYSGHVFEDGEWVDPIGWGERVETVKEWLAGNCSGPMDYNVVCRTSAGLESFVIGTLRGKPAAAAIFWENFGGPFTPKHVGLVVEREGRPECVATEALGDGTVLSKQLDHERIVLEVLRVGEHDCSANPTEHVRLTYAWDGGGSLKLVSTETLPPVVAAPVAPR